MNSRHASRRLWLTSAWLLVLCLSVAAPAVAQEASRIIDGEPYDQITLKEDMVLLKVKPLDIKERKPLADKDPDFKLHVRLLSKPLQQYEVTWADIEKVQLFEEVALAEAAALVEAKQFDGAYEYYQFLERRDKKFPGVVDGYTRAMFREAQHWLEQKQPDQALAILGEVHGRNPKWEGLEQTIGDVTGALVTVQLDIGNFLGARRLLKGLSTKYPQHPVVAKHEMQLTKEATEALKQARDHLAGNRPLEAYQQATIAVARWPSLEGAKDLLIEIHGKYPMVLIGVLRTGRAHVPLGREGWAELRERRLLTRLLVEPTGYRDGQLEFAGTFATLQATESLVKLQLREGLEWAAGGGGDKPLGPVTAYDLARCLAAMSQPRDAAWSPVLAENTANISVTGPLSVDVQLARPLARPGLLFVTALTPWHQSRDAAHPATLSGYTVADRQASLTRFVANPHYFEKSKDQPREILERKFSDSRQAIRALVAGEIAALDRIDLEELALAKRQNTLNVVRYAAPTVHMLIPNPHRPLGAERAFRRAAWQSLEKADTLAALLKKSDASHGKLLTGPFPVGYAYNDKVEDYPNDRRMSVALTAAAIEAATSIRRGGEPLRASALRKLSIGHPPTAIARKACRAIADQLSIDGRHAEGIGFDVELKEFDDDGLPATLPRDCDLVYVEWPQMEPLLAARRLFAAGGLAADCGPWLDRAVRAAEQAGSLAEQQKALQELHRLVRDEAAVIPLWQIDEYCAFRKALAGTAAQPVTLYQDVEKWQCPPSIPAE